MRTDLNQDQIDYYQDNGFIIIHDFLNDEELKLWSEAVDEAVKSRGKTKLVNGDGKSQCFRFDERRKGCKGSDIK